MPRDTPVTPCSPPFHSDGRCRAALRGRSRKAAVVTTARHRVSRPPENPGSEGHRAARNRPVLPPRHPAPDAVGGREAERALRSRPRQPAAGRPRTGTVRAQRTDGATARRGPARLPSDAAPPGAGDCSAVRASPGTAARAPASERHPAAGLDARLSARRRSLQRAHRLGQAPGTGRARDGAARPAGAEGADEGLRRAPRTPRSMVVMCWARGRLAVVRDWAHRATAAGPVLRTAVRVRARRLHRRPRRDGGAGGRHLIVCVVVTFVRSALFELVAVTQPFPAQAFDQLRVIPETRVLRHVPPA